MNIILVRPVRSDSKHKYTVSSIQSCTTLQYQFFGRLFSASYKPNLAFFLKPAVDIYCCRYVWDLFTTKWPDNGINQAETSHLRSGTVRLCVTAYW